MKFTEDIKKFFIKRKVRKFIKAKKTINSMQNLRIDSLQHGITLMNVKMDAMMRFLKKMEEKNE